MYTLQGMPMANESCPEDILSSSLHMLYSYTPIASSGTHFTHKASGLTVLSPNPAPSNWALHASSIWIASLFLAKHIEDVALMPLYQTDEASVLELGAGSGLPGILFAQRASTKLQVKVTLSDYPDESVLATLEENVKINNIHMASVRVVGHAWGDSISALGTHDIVLAADTIWNSDMHLPFCQTLSGVLRRSEYARIYLVAGLHSGRWTIHAFLNKLELFGLVTESLVERKVDGTFDDEEIHIPPTEREWRVERDGEEESELRNWVVWIVVKWAKI
jgi:EEF1A N-terminal glycine/lysine methyltransferase